jgi:hypothetical protein
MSLRVFDELHGLSSEPTVWPGAADVDSATQEEAVQSAIGEGVERYAASIWPAEQLIFNCLSEVRERAFDPRWLTTGCFP